MAKVNRILKKVFPFLGRHRDCSTGPNSNHLLSEGLSQLELCASINSIKELSGGIAHEINNPLAIILGRAQLVKIRSKKSSLSPEFLEESMAKVEEASQRIGSIVSALRLITKDGTKEPISIIEITRLIDNVKTFWAARLKNHEIDFSIQIHCPEARLRCREAQITTVILNLLSNAFHASRSARNEFKNHAWIKLEVISSLKGIEISVSDSGAGIPIGNRKRIFDPFFTTREVGDGSGLGLTISHSIATDHGGDLYLDETSEHTKFVVVIPALVGHQQAA
ncbi:MAG: hypothetical protein BroJett040_12670 [Oligoflexia bacterium]|nr:MAG: hypothetical protein BroJett040_12670 [Oligoflexia bacterium]